MQASNYAGFSTLWAAEFGSPDTRAYHQTRRAEGLSSQESIIFIFNYVVAVANLP